MTSPQNSIGAVFRQLHHPGDPFVLVNVSDIGSARLMESLGAKALATSSAALAFRLGKADGTITRDEAIAHASEIVHAVNIPVSGDFENGYGDSPECVAETVRLAHEAGLAGISIEDTKLPTDTPYPFEQAVERIHAAAEAARGLPDDFVLVARADGVKTGAYDFAEALRRVLAFEQVGADCLFAPLLKNFADLKALCEATALPVNALVAGDTTRHTKADFANIGVAGLSLGPSLARTVYRLMIDAGQAMLGERGDFTPLANAIDGATVGKLILR